MEENTKNLKIFFLVESLNYQHLRKSFTCIPRKLMEKYKVNAELVCGNSSNLSDDLLKITNLGSGGKIILLIKSILNLVKDRSKLDIIMLLHLNIPTATFIYFIAIFFPRVKIYLKLDINIEFFSKKFSLFKLYMFKGALKRVDCISYESINVESLIKKSSLFQDETKKLTHIPNCIPESSDFHKFEHREKENIFLTVGRLGSYQKNTELIIDAIRKLELDSWKFIFIGEVTNVIKKELDELKQLGKNIEVLGEVENREKLIDYYLRSKVFILSSRYEGFATVLVEAGLFGNYIISTDVNGAKDITNNFKYARKITSASDLYHSMLDIIDNKVDIDSEIEVQRSYVSEKFNWNSVIVNSPLSEKLGLRPRNF